MKTKYLIIFINPQNLNVPKKSLTGFCMVQLACLSQKTFASYEEDISMKTKRNNEIALMVIFLTLFATNGFAYSQQTLTTGDVSEIKIVKTKLEHSAYSTVSQSPVVINNLRLMFSKNKKNKLSR